MGTESRTSELLKTFKSDIFDSKSAHQTNHHILQPSNHTAITLADSSIAAPTAVQNKLIKRVDVTCQIIKDSLWRYSIQIPGDGYDDYGGTL